jgi:sialate O-acetylesterase
MRTLLLALAMTITLSAQAQIKLPNTLSDHAVLQRDQPTQISGWALPGEHITVTLHEQTLTATADSTGEWNAYLAPEKAGGPYTMTVTGDAANQKPVTRTDILVGDVWLASGQSNMEMPLKGFNPQMQVKDHEAEIAAAHHPKIRLLLQPKNAAGFPQFDTTATWTECTPETAANFSAVAYFFGREIAEKEDVPVGLIDATWGGTPVAAWTSLDAIASNNLTYVGANAALVAQDDARAVANKYGDDAARAAGVAVAPHPMRGQTHNGAWTGAALYNGMIAPYTRTTIRGVIWYQGETDSSASRAAYYRRSFPALIRDWRDQWGEGAFPFLFVQISSFRPGGDGWAEVRDAQRRTLDLVRTGMAVTLDVGNPTNVHPADKQTVGHRLALAAEQISYAPGGHAVEGTSPAFRTMSTEGSAARLWFDHAVGLTTHGQALGGFELAGEDGKFYPATAQIDHSAAGKDDTVLLRATQVQVPTAARYDWSGEVTTFFYNDAGLPAGTFTTEN